MKAFIFSVVVNISNKLSLKSNRKLAIFLSGLIWRFSKKNKATTLTNVQKCYPNLSVTQQNHTAKACIQATIMNMFELGIIWGKNNNENTVIDNIYGLENFQSALNQNKGLLLALPHMGNWEVLNLVLEKFKKYAFLYKAPTDKKLENLLVKYRGKSKALQIEASIKGVRKIMKHLKNKGFVTILPDQRPKSGQGIFSTFYEIPTYTMTLFSKLAIKTKVPVFFAYALRTSKGFDVYFEKSDDTIYLDIQTSVDYMNQKIKDIVDKAPEQYQWTYKRFSIQPDSEPPFYT